MKTLKEFVALPGENVLEMIEGNAYNDSPNPITRLLMFIVKICQMILGIKLFTYIIITNLRVVKVNKKTILWGILPGSVEVMTINKRTVRSVGYAMDSSWFIFRKYYFQLDNGAEMLRVTYNGSLEQLTDICTTVDKVVTESH